MTNATEITNSQIAALKSEAAQAGDSEMIETCQKALTGDEGARSACADAINNAAAQA